MNKPKLYRQVNSFQRGEAEKVLQEFSWKINWCLNGGDSILDAGCGTGDVTREILMPILPAKFKRLIGIDVSQEMIDYARKTQIHPKLSFEQFDLNIDIEKQTLNSIEQHDHIFSFYCLHWVQNLRIGIQNLYKLLKPGGNMLIMFALSNPLFDVYKEQCKNSPWSKYMSDIEQKLPPYQNRDTVNSDEFRGILSECGFLEYDIHVQDRCFTLEDIDSLWNLLHSVDLFIDRIPVDQKQAYMNDVVRRMIRKSIVQNDLQINDDTLPITLRFKRIVAYARK